MKSVSKIIVIAIVLLLNGCIGSNEDPPKEMYTVSFETYGGTEVASIDVEEGEGITVSDYSSSLDGFIFLGWTLLTQEEVDDLDTDIPYQEGELIPESDITLYVVWEEVETNNDEDEGEFLTLLGDFEDVMLFAQYFSVDEVLDLEIRNSEDTLLSESTTITSMYFAFQEEFMELAFIDSNGNEFNTQSFASGGNIITIYKDGYQYVIDKVSSTTFEEYIVGENDAETLVDKTYQSVEKIDDFKFEVVYNLLDYFTSDELEMMFPYGSGVSYDDVEVVSVVYDFSDRENKIYINSVSIDGLTYSDDYTVDFLIEVVYSVLSEYEIEYLKPEDHIFEPAKSLEDVVFAFDQEDDVYFNQTFGENIIAFRLTPGDYAVFGDGHTTMRNPYLIFYDENGQEIIYGSYMHIEEETIVYLNYTAYGSYTNPRRHVAIREVDVLHEGEMNPDNITGSITIEFTEEDLNETLIFPDGTFDGIIIFDAITVNSGNELLLTGDTRCEGTTQGDTCAIKTYNEADITISITALKAGTVTLEYRLVEYDDISTDSANPTQIESIVNGVELENNEWYYIEFDSTGATYQFNVQILHPGYYITIETILIDSEGNIISSSWSGNEYLETGTYTVKFAIEGFHSAVLPMVEVVD
jgi:hypothetical protein